MWAATASPEIGAVVSFYYVMPHGKPEFSKLNAPVLGHFGTYDQYISVDDAESLEAELQQAGVEAAFEFYEGAGHAFFADHNRLGTYHEEHANNAWGKTVDFFHKHLSRKEHASQNGN